MVDVPERVLRGLAVLAVLGGTLVPVAAAAADPVGRVTRLRGEASVTRAGGALALGVGSPVETGDVIETEGDARLEVLFADGAVLTLGEDADLVVADYVYAEATGGRAALQVAGGAFAVATGALARLDGPPFAVQTPFATIGVRGTRFWGGPVDVEYGPQGQGILVLEGIVSVTTPGGAVVLDQPGRGTVIPGRGAVPDPPVTWAAPRVAAALATVAFE